MFACGIRGRKHGTIPLLSEHGKERQHSEVKKRDGFILGGVLLLALLAFAASRLLAPQTPSAIVTVFVGGSEYRSVRADDYQTITIDQGNGKVNVVVIDERGVRMESSTCKNQICVHHGVVDPKNADKLLLDNWIICLPNGVTVEVTPAGEQP